MKYLKTFNTKSEYKSAKKAHSIRVPYTCMVNEDYMVYTRPAFVDKEYAEAGDIIVYSKAAYEAWEAAEDGSTAEAAAYQTLLNSTAFMRPEYFDATAAQKYLPEAIVVVPYSHTGDGTVRAMSLKLMSPANPENGAIDRSTNVIFGARVDIVDVTNYGGGAALVNPELGETSTLSSTNNVYLPSDSFTTLEVPGSDGEYYWYNINGNYAPCPYKADGSLNRQYLGEYGINSKLTNNWFADMDGIHNTKSIINALDKAYINNTLFGNTITNAETQTIEGVSTNIFPAAMCCQRYKTVLKPNAISYDSDTDSYSYGDWYLPSAGEVGYVVVNQGSISYALYKIKSALSSIVASNMDIWLWSSSESTNYFYALVTVVNIGNVGGTIRSNNGWARAFAKY